MKKIIIAILFIFCLPFVYGQEKKPTKEETISFIKRTVETSIGSVYNSTRTTEIIFEYDRYKRVSVMEVKRDNQSAVIVGNYDEEWSLLKWDNLDKKEFELQNCPVGENDICEMWIFFSRDIKHTEIERTKYVGNKDETKFTHYLPILIPKEKFESMKKAFLRLAEIAKEENKDPFAN